MNRIVGEFLSFVKSCGDIHNKATLTGMAQKQFRLVKDRSIYYCPYFAVRFCQTKGKSFSNTVLSLSALHKYDNIPVFVVLVSGNSAPRLFLANSTFINKISHSSQQLSMTNIKGSFNGSDIIKAPFDIPNDIDHVEELFPFHHGVGWAENLKRIVDNTHNIVATGKRYDVDDETRERIMASIERAARFVKSHSFNELKGDLDNRVKLSEEAIICAARIENVNIRGRLIETLVTAGPEQRKEMAKALQEAEMSLPEYKSPNELGDYCRRFDDGDTMTDIKTKILYLDSNPKAYNVDKFLEAMSRENSVFLFYFIGIDADGIVNKILCSVYHEELVDNTVVQFHWAGRNSRGVTQFVGKAIDGMIRRKDFVNVIDEPKARAFVDRLIAGGDGA